MESFKDTSIVKKGLDKKAFDIIIKDIRDHAVNRYGQVDDMPYGGGPGMLLRPEPVFEAFQSLKLKKIDKVIYFSPKGRKIDHNYIINLTKLKNIVLICGHYEGVDQRVIDTLVDEQVSLGDFVLTGGELPAMVLVDSVVRQIDGVIKESSLKDESFSHNLLEHRQYTRPYDYNGLKVPDILLSGNHKKIEEYKLKDSIKETIHYRKDLLENKDFNKDIKKIILKYIEESKE